VFPAAQASVGETALTPDSSPASRVTGPCGAGGGAAAASVTIKPSPPAAKLANRTGLPGAHV